MPTRNKKSRVAAMCCPISWQAEIFVTLEHRRHDGGVLGMDVTIGGALRQAETPIALMLVIQNATEAFGPARRAGGDQRVVEVVIALFPFVEPAFERPPGFVLDQAKAMKGRDDRGFPGVVAQLHGLAQPGAFELDAGVGDVFQVVFRHLRHPETALALRRHQGVGDQQRQGLAHGSGADAVFRFQMLNRQARARQQLAVQDVTPQLLINSVDARLAGRFIDRASGWFFDHR